MDTLISVLNSLGFEVQKTSYEYLTSKEPLDYLHSIKLPENDALNILRYFPDYFVMHRQLRPLLGAFFIVEDKGLPLPPKAQEMYRKYFPNKIALVSKGKSNHYFAKWLHSTTNPELLELFVQRLQEK